MNEAIRNGKMIKPLKCSYCNLEKDLQAHHEDYSKPLEVIWLCPTCHSALHKKKREENGFQYKPKREYIKKGYNNKGKSKPYKKDDRYKKAIELREQGNSYKKISEITGISQSQIYKWINNPEYN